MVEAADSAIMIKDRRKILFEAMSRYNVFKLFYEIKCACVYVFVCLFEKRGNLLSPIIGRKNLNSS